MPVILPATEISVIRPGDIHTFKKKRKANKLATSTINYFKKSSTQLKLTATLSGIFSSL